MTEYLIVLERYHWISLIVTFRNRLNVVALIVKRSMVSLKDLLIWVAMDALVTSAESANKIVSCAACQVMSSHSAWECDVKCNTAPDGTLIYGESKEQIFTSYN